MLEVYPSTHRKMTNFSQGKLIDIFRSFIDKKYSIFQSNNQIAIMNSATRHTVAKENNKQGSIRVLYFFVSIFFQLNCFSSLFCPILVKRVICLQKLDKFLAMAAVPPKYLSLYISRKTRIGSFPDLPKASQKHTRLR